MTDSKMENNKVFLDLLTGSNSLSHRCCAAENKAYRLSGGVVCKVVFHYL